MLFSAFCPPRFCNIRITNSSVAKYLPTRDGSNYVFCNDEEILALNRKYIGHDYYTDHIGFDYSARDILSGDIYVGIETVKTNAELFGKTYDDELHRVIVHGLLHLVGFKDKTPKERTSMEAAEDKALAMR